MSVFGLAQLARSSLIIYTSVNNKNSGTVLTLHPTSLKLVCILVLALFLFQGTLQNQASFFGLLGLGRLKSDRMSQKVQVALFIKMKLQFSLN